MRTDKISLAMLRTLLGYAASATAAEVTRYGRLDTSDSEAAELEHQERLSWIAGRAVQGAIDLLCLSEAGLEPVYCAVHEVTDCVGHLLRARLTGNLSCISTITWWPTTAWEQITLAGVVEERLVLLVHELQQEGAAVQPQPQVAA